MKTEKCMVCEHGIDATLQWENEMMEKHGWFVHYISNAEDGMGNAHTHGLDTTFHHSDLQIVLPLPTKTCQSIFHNAVKRIKDGEKFEDKQIVQKIIAGLPVQMVEAEENGREVLRIIIPDKNGELLRDKMVQEGFKKQWDLN